MCKHASLLVGCLHQFSQTEIKLDVDFAVVFLSKMSDFEVTAEATELDAV